MSLDPEAQRSLASIRADIDAATKIAVLSGAGLSAASGIPTFRGAQDSLWSQYRPEDLATPEAFARDPELVWRWYDWRRGLIADAEPNAAHRALADLQTKAQVSVITQNVDGYHQQAGSRQVLEFHGSIWQVRCTACGRQTEDRQVPIPIPPHCEVCGGLLRPGVVWFGEGIDPAVLQESAATVSECNILLVVGTAGAVYPAAGLVEAASNVGATIVEFNVERSAVSRHADVFVAGSAADTVGEIVP